MDREVAMRTLLLLLALGGAASATEQSNKPFDAAAAFGSRPGANSISLSPDGTSIAFIMPSTGRSSILFTMKIDAEAKARPALTSDGKPFRLQSCEWVSNSRLVCTLYFLARQSGELAPFTRLIAIDSDGRDFKLLSEHRGLSLGSQLGGGAILDLLPDEDGVVLMAEFGVNRVDTRTLQKTNVERPTGEPVGYISDGRGNVRIMGVQAFRSSTGQLQGVIKYLYRTVGSREWHPLGEFDEINFTGFRPIAVDPDLNVAFGYKKRDGRFALYKVALDGTMREDLVYERPDVDVYDTLFIGRRHRLVGVTYATDRLNAFYFDPAIKGIYASLERALPNQPIIRITDSSVDESKLLVYAGSDNDPGTFYLFDRTTKQMRPLLAVREAIEGTKLASVKAIEYPASDGTMIPGYLTLPPGREDARGLPGIVIPHGGPTARDLWGFDWIAQFFASRGFAVLQPNYRGSFGYGDTWFEKNGFHAWRVAVGDVLDGGRWLVTQGVDASKLAIIGWSYGGYAALQSAVVDPSVFKAVVAIAPITDLNEITEERRGWTDYSLTRKTVGKTMGNGSQLREGSPLENAGSIKVPVLLFHGTLDRNVAYAESQRMASALTAAHDRCELITFEDLDHQLDDSDARTQMLRKSDAFLREIMGL
jgi:dipeptidyl aminopeptidase/acylaminoacyl peptidase